LMVVDGDEMMEVVAGVGSTLDGEKKNGEESFLPGDGGSVSQELEEKGPRMGFAGRPEDCMDNSGQEKPIPAPPVKEGFAEKRDADAGVVPGCVAVTGCPRVSEPGSNTLLPPGCLCDEPGGAGNDWRCCWVEEEESDVETTAARGERDREFGSATPPDVGERLMLVLGWTSLSA
jgi:hypothetical protein